jgi:enoyl-CoA hydratase
MALTGNEVSGADAIHCGLADFFGPSDKISDLLQALHHQDPEAALMSFVEETPASQLALQAKWIDACYATDSVEESLERLQAHGGEAATAADDISARSPTSVKVTFRAVRSAASLPSVEAALEQEFRIASHLLRSHDLLEGIRAQVIDKDRNPRWQPATLGEITDDMVDAYFKPSADLELRLA